jgi:integrase/recombinase XerD
MQHETHEQPMAESPSLEARCKVFETHLITERGVARTTARMRALLVRKVLRQARTLIPTKEQVQAAKETHLMEGYHRGYVVNICIALANYGEYLGIDLKVKPPSQENRKVPRFMTEQEVQAFLFCIDSVRDRALFTVLAYTGLRCAELCSLRREDVAFESKGVTVQNGKGGKSMEVPISQTALTVLSAYLRSGTREDKSEWLFHGPNGVKLSTNRIRVLARKYGRQGGVSKPVSPHMFRHALATNLLSKGCPLPFVQRQLRHSRIETTMRYLHLSDKALRDNYERFLPEY